MRKRIFEIIENAEEGDRLSEVYDTLVIVTVVVSLIPLAFKYEHPAFRVIELVSLVIFIVDYLLRLATADYKYGEKSVRSFLRYPFSFMALVDLLTILPSLTALNSGFKVLRLMRMIRALRVLRVFKTLRYSQSIQIIVKVLKRSEEPLAAVASLSMAYILVSALIIINVEPDSFENFFDAIYWATVSLTTVGYGDIYPVTAAGKIVTMLSSMFGIAIVALPSGIITAGYLKELDRNRQEEERNSREEEQLPERETADKNEKTVGSESE